MAGRVNWLSRLAVARAPVALGGRADARRAVSTLAKVSAVGAGILLRVFYKELSAANRRLLWSRGYWVQLVRDGTRLWKVLLVGGAVSLGVLAAAYDTTPVTHRPRMLWQSRKAMRDLALSVESALYDVYEDQIVDAESDDPRVARTRETLVRLVQAARRHPELGSVMDRLGLKFSLCFIEDEEPRMFVIPSGTVFVFSGMVEEVQDPDAFACMLAHEMVHCLFQHRCEELSQGDVLHVFRAFAYTLGMATGPSLLVGGAMSVASESAVAKLYPAAYRRGLEREADVVGLILASRACFDPRAAPTEWERLATEFPEDREGLDKLSVFTDSHPSHSDRVVGLQAALPNALLERSSCKCKPLEE